MPEGNETPDVNEEWVDLVPVKAIARIDLAARLREAEHGAKRSEPKEAEPSKPPPPPTKVPWPMIATVAVLAVAGLGAGWAFTRVSDKEETIVQSPATPSKRPSPSATPRFTPRPTPVPVPPPQPPPANTYTVLPGDTLITIGEKLNKDWRAIAAANGFITDPNLIYPGQVLRIP